MKSLQVSKQSMVTSCYKNSQAILGSSAAVVWGCGSVRSAAVSTAGGHPSVTQLVDAPVN